MKAATLLGDDSDWCPGRAVGVTNESHIDNNGLCTHQCDLLVLFNHRDVNYSTT